MIDPLPNTVDAPAAPVYRTAMSHRSSDVQLTERRALVLGLIVREHIAHGQPVSSHWLIDHYELGVSSATIRNEMAALEEMGLLGQPHTSAGRVPTVAGYRLFVERLMRHAALAPREMRTIRHQFQQAGGDVERWLRLAAGVVASATGAAGLVAVPETPTVAGSAALPLELTVPRLYHAGLAECIEAPEFAEAESRRGIVRLLERGDGLRAVLDRLPPEGVHVLIGGEPPLEHVPYLTLVLARFGRGGHGGIVGVVGPTRLAYERAVPAVEFVSGVMSRGAGGEVA